VGLPSDAPYPLFWLPGDGPGRVGMCPAPGGRGRSLAADLDRLAGELGVARLVCLLEDRDLDGMGMPDLVVRAAERGIAVERLPIRDFAVPASLAEVRALVARLTGRVEGGERCAIHCAAGVGRTGTVAGCLLAAGGLRGEAIFETLTATRGCSSPETEEQRRFVLAFAASLDAPPTRGDRIVGSVLGAAIGDALGAPTEFVGSFSEIRRRWPPDGVRGFVAEGRGPDGAARYTDDTQMAEVVLEALVRHRGEPDGFEPVMEAIAQGFVRWLRHPQGGHRFPGRACMLGCRALERGVPWREAGGSGEGGCGSVMRCFPFGLRFADDPDEAVRWSVAHSPMTHPDPIALAACAAMARGTALCAAGLAAAAVLDHMVADAARQDVRTARMMTRAIAEARDGTPPEVSLTRLQGWAAHEAIAAAVYVFARHHDDFAAAVLEGANAPGDSDSIATLAGALVGARVGLAGMPDRWIAELERSAELAALAARLEG
jgi:ADP-ribosylglycohydrolase/protein-tyrosine phosphatase